MTRPPRTWGEWCALSSEEKKAHPLFVLVPLDDAEPLFPPRPSSFFEEESERLEGMPAEDFLS